MCWSMIRLWRLSLECRVTPGYRRHHSIKSRFLSSLGKVGAGAAALATIRFMITCLDAAQLRNI